MACELPGDGILMSKNHATTDTPVNSPRQVLFASMIGTTIEFFDFYIYATAAVLVFPGLVLSGVRSGLRHARFAGDVWDRVSGAAGWLGALRPFRRPHRPQDHAGRRALDHGRLHRRHRRLADLPHDRLRRAATAGALPLWPGTRTRRRMGRRSAPGDRERASREARLVRHVSAARRAARIFPFRRRLSGAFPVAHRTSNFSPSAGGFRFWRARCWFSSASTCG